MKCIRFDVCKHDVFLISLYLIVSSMKCIRFDVCKTHANQAQADTDGILNEVHTF